MRNTYRTVQGYGQAEVEINKSRFIAYVNRAESEEEAIAFLERIRKQHWDATHNCAAYIVGENEEHQKANDDGEPSGTAGRPILEVIKRSALTDTIIIVTRYFGGIKLGTGGLIRAYGKSAVVGLEAAGIVERQLHTRMTATIDYSLLGVVENQLRNHHYVIIDKHFANKVTLVSLEHWGQESLFETRLADWTSGQAIVEQHGQEYMDVNIEKPSCR